MRITNPLILIVFIVFGCGQSNKNEESKTLTGADSLIVKLDESNQQVQVFRKGDLKNTSSNTGGGNRFQALYTSNSGS